MVNKVNRKPGRVAESRVINRKKKVTEGMHDVFSGPALKVIDAIIDRASKESTDIEDIITDEIDIACTYTSDCFELARTLQYSTWTEGETSIEEVAENALRWYIDEDSDIQELRGW